MARDIVSTCVDERYPEVLPVITAMTGVDPLRYHHIPAFGCSRGLDHEFELYELVINELKATRVSIYDHLQCRAFRRRFGDLKADEERDYHVDQLLERARQLRERYPDLEVRLFLLTDVTEERIGTELMEVSERGLVAIA